MNRNSVHILKRLLPVLAIALLLSQPALAQVKKAALFPLAFHGDASKGYLRPGLRSMFISRLSDRNIEIISDEAVNAVFEAQDSQGVGSPDRAEELGRRIGADYALFGSITTLGGSYSLDLGILDLAQAQPEPQWLSATATEEQLFGEVANLANAAKAAMGGTVVAAAAPPQAPLVTPAPETNTPQSAPDGLMFKTPGTAEMMAPAGSLPVELAVMASETGDLDGDGAMELMVLAREKILVYTQTGDRFALKDELKPSSGSLFLKVSAGDLDGDGRDELCITSESGKRAESSLWQWAGRFEKRYELKGHLRITKSGPGQKPLLLFQESQSDGENFFVGGIWVMGYSGKGEPVKQRPLPLPGGAQFYTIAFDDIDGDGSAETLFLGPIDAREKGQLMLSNAAGKILWQSQETFGATNNLVLVDVWDPKHRLQRFPLNSTPVLMDTDGDGRREVIAAENLAGADIITHKQFKRSQLSVFKVSGNGLALVLTSGENPYPVADMQVEKGVLFIATHKPGMTNLSKASGEVMWFK